MAEELLSAARARGIGRLLLVTLGFAVLLAVLAIPLLMDSYVVYGSIVVGIAVVLATMGVLALRAVRGRLPVARRLSITTGVLLVVLSVPLMPIWVGLLTVITGIGLLVVVLAPERDEEPAP